MQTQVIKLSEMYSFGSRINTYNHKFNTVYFNNILGQQNVKKQKNKRRAGIDMVSIIVLK